MERYIINKKLTKDVNIALNLTNSITQVGLGETINTLVENETSNSVNPFEDTEQIAYRATSVEGIEINFRFYNKVTNTFQNSYEAAGFDTVNGLIKNSFTKSYFRLYFYDSNEPTKRNLVLFEDIDVVGTKQPMFKLNRIYWFRNDKEFKNTNNNKTFYIIGRFFNASNGKVYDFMNLPLSYTSPITINDYSQNNQWWSSPMEILNPKNNNGNHNFSVLSGFGANGINSITLTEQVII